jgi:hypothetical protein
MKTGEINKSWYNHSKCQVLRDSSRAMSRQASALSSVQAKVSPAFIIRRMAGLNITRAPSAALASTLARRVLGSLLGAWSRQGLLAISPWPVITPDLEPVLL